MHYESKISDLSETMETFHSKRLLGPVLASAYPDRTDGICAAQPPPPVQKAFNIKTMRTEPVKAGGRFVGLGECRPRLVKCTEGIELQAVPASPCVDLLLRVVVIDGILVARYVAVIFHCCVWYSGSRLTQISDGVWTFMRRTPSSLSWLAPSAIEMRKRMQKTALLRL